MSTSLAKLPFCSFALTGSGTNGVGRAWQLDIDLEANRPMKFFGLVRFMMVRPITPQRLMNCISAYHYHPLSQATARWPPRLGHE